MDAAIAMGRLIRARKLDVAVGYTTFSSCAPRQKGCNAARTRGYLGRLCLLQLRVPPRSGGRHQAAGWRVGTSWRAPDHHEDDH